MAWVVISLIWLAAAYRLWVSFTRPATLWRTSFTITAVCVAAAFTIYRAQAVLDGLTRIPNSAGLVARLVMLVGVGFLLIYHEHLRRAQVPTTVIVVHLSTTAVVILVEVVAWTAAPVHDRPLGDLVTATASTPVAVYCIVFWVYLAGVLGLASRTCLAGGRTFRRTDPARSVSLLLIGLGELLGIPVFVLWTASMLARHRAALAQRLNSAGDAVLPWPLLFDAVGVLSLLTVPYVSSLLGRWRQWRRLRPLWVDLVHRYPEVRLDLRFGGGPLGRLQLRVERAVIEMRDALRVAPIDADPSRAVSVDAVARALRAHTEGSTSAADALGRLETREADIEQLLDLARAYEEVDRARA